MSDLRFHVGILFAAAVSAIYDQRWTPLLGALVGQSVLLLWRYAIPRRGAAPPPQGARYYARRERR